RTGDPGRGVLECGASSSDGYFRCRGTEERQRQRQAHRNCALLGLRLRRRVRQAVLPTLLPAILSVLLLRLRLSSVLPSLLPAVPPALLGWRLRRLWRLRLLLPTAACLRRPAGLLIRAAQLDAPLSAACERAEGPRV